MIINKFNLFRYYSIALHGIGKHKIVPDLIDIIPSDLAEVVYPNGIQVEIASELKPIDVKDPPRIRWAAKPKSYYTICLLDPDAPSKINPILREWHHWLVGNIPGNSIEEGETLTEYIGAGPPRGSGLHRYVFLVFEQKGLIEFKEEKLDNRSIRKRAKFSIRNFARKYQLGKPVAANFFHAQWDDYVPTLYAQMKILSDSSQT